MPSLGLVIPTMNSRRYLPRHVKGILPWIDLVQEILVVDSHSTDGSVDYLREHLPSDRLRVSEHPPGLYASWNHGISRLQSEFFIMSTTGDTITRQGVSKLLRHASEASCDIVLSKPAFVDLEGQPHIIRWPVDEIVEKLQVGDFQKLSRLEALVFAAAHPESSLLGSSASNIYRTAFFKERTFPLDWGVAGDAGWVWQHVAEAQWGVLSGCYSTFLLHPPQSLPQDIRPVFRHRPDEVLNESIARWTVAGIVEKRDLAKIGWDKLFGALKDYLDLKTGLDLLRDHRGFWFVNPAAWKQRKRRREASCILRRERDRALAALENSRQSGAQGAPADGIRASAGGENLTFLFFHYGGTPIYLRYAIEHVRMFNPRAEICLVAEKPGEARELDRHGVRLLSTADLPSAGLDRFRESYRHISCFKEKFERFVLERWFMAENLRRERPDRVYIMQDSDVAVFGDASKLLPLLPDCPIALSGPNPHFTFVRGPLGDFLDFILGYYADEERLANAQKLYEERRNSDDIYNLGEMTLLFEFLEKSRTMQMFDTDTPHGYVDTNLHMPESFDHMCLRRRPRKKVLWCREGDRLIPYFLRQGNPVRAFVVHFQGPGKRVFFRFNYPGQKPPASKCFFLNLLFQNTALANFS